MVAHPPLKQIQAFGWLLILAGVFAGLPLMGLAVNRGLGVLSMTFGVGLLLAFIGYVGARLIMLARQAGRDAQSPQQDSNLQPSA